MWELLVAETRTGQIVAELPFTDFTWSTPINDIGALRATIPLEKTSVGLGPWDDRDPQWVLESVLSGEWKFSVCAVFDRQPIWAGPLETHQWDAGEATVEIGCAELPALFKLRTLIKPGAVSRTDPTADSSFGPLSLPGIMLALIQQAIDPANGAGYDLPLILPTVNTKGENVRNYLAADTASYWDRMRQLIEVENGPDLRFDPVLNADRTLLSWRVRIGEPYLGGTEPHIWDHGAGLRSVSVDRDASGMTMRAYVPGQAAPEPAATESSTDQTAPQDAPKPIGIAEDLALISEGYPILERVYTDNTSTIRQATLDAHAAGYVTADKRPVEQWNVSIDATQDPQLGEWSVGDLGAFDVRGAFGIRDGVHVRRVIGASGDAGTNVQLALTPAPGTV